MKPMRPAQRRYTIRIAVAMTAYMITLYAAVSMIRSGQAVGTLAWILALLPGLCVAGVFWAVGRLLVEETDEYLRMLLVRQVLIATGLTLSIVTVYGFLENFELVNHIDGFYVAMLWFIGLGVGGLVNRLSVGSDGGC